jgi:hypothetical protein
MGYLCQLRVSKQTLPFCQAQVLVQVFSYSAVLPLWGTWPYPILQLVVSGLEKFLIVRAHMISPST